MQKKNSLNKILSIAGTVLSLLPIAAPIVFAFAALFTRGKFLFDYLMPGEIFFVYLAGALLLLWGSLRMKSRRKWIIWSAAAAVMLLAASMGVASLSGLASGRIEAQGFWWILTLTLLIASELAMVCTGAGGIGLIGDAFKKE